MIIDFSASMSSILHTIIWTLWSHRRRDLCFERLCEVEQTSVVVGHIALQTVYLLILHAQALFEPARVGACLISEISLIL